VIALYELIAIGIYLNASHPTKSNESELFGYLFIWIFSQAIGSFLLGILSDRYCRRKMLIISLSWGAAFLPIIYFLTKSNFVLLMFGLGFSPSPIARASLVDNFPSESKLKLMCLTFVAQFIPWVFYMWIALIPKLALFWLSFICLLTVLALSLFWFRDRRDKNLRHSHGTIETSIHRHAKRRVSCILLALIFAQIIFFLTDSYFENISSSSGFYSALGIGSLLGTGLALFYRKTPHVSIITITYGLGFLLSIMPLISVLFLNIAEVNIKFQIMVFSNLGGFYLPFIYDIILSNFSRSSRGTACGIVDLVISFSSLVGMTLTIYLHPKEIQLVLITTVLFLIATVVQKIGESNEIPPPSSS